MTFPRFSSINLTITKSKDCGAPTKKKVLSTPSKCKRSQWKWLLRLKASSQSLDRNQIDSAQKGGKGSSSSTTAKVFGNQRKTS